MSDSVLFFVVVFVVILGCGGLYGYAIMSFVHEDKKKKEKIRERQAKDREDQEARKRYA